MTTSPTLADIEAAAARIAPHVIETPTVPWPGPELGTLLTPGTDVVAKLELLQRTGSFKARGAVNVIMGLSPEERARGVVAISAGNHAIAVGYAARVFGLSAKVVMPKSANPFRVARCRDLGADVVLADDIHEGFALVRRLEGEEGRVLVHPFEGPRTFEATGTVGLELIRQATGLDAVIVPVGGGGLIAGMAAAIKQAAPGILVIGVEPEGARGMSDSLAAGEPLARVAVSTIADSLGPPMHLPQSFALVKQYVDQIVTVTDQDMIDATGLLFRDVKLAVEPAPAAGVAALVGPLRIRLSGKRVGLVICGANIDAGTFARHLAAARPLRR